MDYLSGPDMVWPGLNGPHLIAVPLAQPLLVLSQHHSRGWKPFLGITDFFLARFLPYDSKFYQMHTL